MLLFSSGVDSGIWKGLISSGKLGLGLGKMLAGISVDTCAISIFLNLFFADFIEYDINAVFLFDAGKLK